mmetsp:Transcript_19247/g.45224  ORF Transcript_19247/g.45224 Transcript_19247/m.45224 type:complete len:111 (+) Transcript_19247:90-422(+)
MATNLLDAGLHQYIDRRRGRAKAVGGADSSGSVGSAGAGAGVGAGAGRLLSAGSTIFFVDDLNIPATGESFALSEWSARITLSCSWTLSVLSRIDRARLPMALKRVLRLS